MNQLVYHRYHSQFMALVPAQKAVTEHLAALVVATRQRPGDNSRLRAKLLQTANETFRPSENLDQAAHSGP